MPNALSGTAGIDHRIEWSTSRLLLRDFVESDYADLRAMESCVEVHRYEQVVVPTPLQTSACLRQAICEQAETPRTHYKLAILVPPQSTVIGRVTLKPLNREIREWEIGWMLHPAQWGKGYAAEAASRLLAFAFGELGAHRVAAFCHALNRQSARVMQKIGMRQEAHFRETLWWNEQWSDEYLYAILDREWRP